MAIIKVLPSITTTNHDIAAIQIEELKELKIKEAGLFITGIQSTQERMQFLKHVKESLPDIHFPLVHIRVDSSGEEAEFCLKNFGTFWMNIHGNHYKKFEVSPLFQFKEYIIAENSKDLKMKHMINYAGICLDLSHYYEDLKNNEKWVKDIEETVQNYNVYCNHISAVRKKEDEVWVEHIGNYCSEFDYLNEISQRYIGTTCSCLEIENTIHTQLKYIDHIQKSLVTFRT